jgi:putative membrane protein
MLETGSKSANDLAVDRTHLAVERTIMAANRTLMAWVRTGISQISFGFTIYKLLQSFQDEGKIPAKHRLLTPEAVGAVLLILGITSIAFGMFEYRATCREYQRKMKTEPVMMAGLIVILGFVFLVGIMFHL